MSPSDQVILITGASRGIGAATARHLAEQGHAVVLTARSHSAVDALAGEIRDGGGRAHALPCDVTDFDAVVHAVSNTIDTFGRLDVLVNNAGIIDPQERLAEIDPAGWADVMNTNLLGVFHGIRAVLPVMLEAGRGTIINVSSGAATSPLEGWSHYCATKAGVLMLTRCVHAEYADQGIVSVGMSPGTVATDMQEAIRTSGINRVSQLDWSKHIPPEWAARAIAYLCTDAARGYAGGDFSIKTPDGRAAIGLPAP